MFSNETFSDLIFSDTDGQGLIIPPKAWTIKCKDQTPWGEEQKNILNIIPCNEVDKCL